MNTANLQLEGLCLAIANVHAALVKKGLLTAAELDAALAAAETTSGSGRGELSDANLDAIRFPIRLLRLANRSAGEGQASFSDLARTIGEARDDTAS